MIDSRYVAGKIESDEETQPFALSLTPESKYEQAQNKRPTAVNDRKDSCNSCKWTLPVRS